MLTALTNIRSTKVLHHASSIMHQPMLEDDLWWTTTFGGRRPLVEDHFWWKTTFGGRWPLVEDELWWKTTFGGRRLSVEDDLRWKTTFGGRGPLVEDNLWLTMTYGGRRPSVEDNFWWKTILACCLVRFAAFFYIRNHLIRKSGWKSQKIKIISNNQARLRCKNQ